MIVPLSNFEGQGPAPVEKYRGMGPYGAYDMAGNVREWVWNESGSNRWILGGAWNEAPYMATYRNSLQPFDRSPVNGFRCVKYAREASLVENLMAPEPSR
jgi:formylglycine-generating enzyme required for sulfatase activity